MGDSGWFRGEGGAVFELALPLSEHMADQHRAGRLVEVDGPGGAGESVTAVKPSQADPKSMWIDYAIASGMSRVEADGHTKAELIEKFG